MGRTAISKNPLRKEQNFIFMVGGVGVFSENSSGEVWQLRGVVPGSQLWVIFLSAVEGVGRVNVQISVKVFVRPVCCGGTRAFYEKILSPKWTYFFQVVKWTVCCIDMYIHALHTPFENLQNLQGLQILCKFLNCFKVFKTKVFSWNSILFWLN